MEMNSAIYYEMDDLEILEAEAFQGHLPQHRRLRRERVFRERANTDFPVVEEFRTRAFNLLQLFDSATVQLSKHYARRACDVANGRQRAAPVRGGTSQETGTVTQVTEFTYQVKSLTSVGITYLVDLNVGACTCRMNRRTGGCKHLRAVRQQTGAVPEATATKETRRALMDIAMGTSQQLPGNWFDPLVAELSTSSPPGPTPASAPGVAQPQPSPGPEEYDDDAMDFEDPAAAAAAVSGAEQRRSDDRTRQTVAFIQEWAAFMCEAVVQDDTWERAAAAFQQRWGPLPTAGRQSALHQFGGAQGCRRNATQIPVQPTSTAHAFFISSGAGAAIATATPTVEHQHQWPLRAEPAVVKDAHDPRIYQFKTGSNDKRLGSHDPFTTLHILMCRVVVKGAHDPRIYQFKTGSNDKWLGSHDPFTTLHILMCRVVVKDAHDPRIYQFKTGSNDKWLGSHDPFTTLHILMCRVVVKNAHDPRIYQFKTGSNDKWLESHDLLTNLHILIIHKTANACRNKRAFSTRTQEEHRILLETRNWLGRWENVAPTDSVRRLQLTINATLQLWDMVKGKLKFQLTRRLSQDSLENFFGMIRQDPPGRAEAPALPPLPEVWTR
ncbi:hypothetical protein FJT64_012389 [Amphibalanus amphitrite]|uniref:SWIM-type domain-containing protein n=1 Tax=Amphibalanus amphitrite TaxID=1232801 RepID=A0A6A4V3X5_AMPAM|nr:hypothetical protein FJT64_012389 [Amphibalanus amphitrite]